MLAAIALIHGTDRSRMLTESALPQSPATELRRVRPRLARHRP
jgi:hypothetical protein